MPKAQPKNLAFIEVIAHFQNWNLPDEYRHVVMAHVASEPSFVYLPWPIDLIPCIGHKISIPAVCGPYADLVVEKIIYEYNGPRTIRVFISVKEPQIDPDKEHIGILKTLAEAGFLFEDMKPMAPVFRKAKLSLEW